MAAPGEVTFEQGLSAKRRVITKDAFHCHEECETMSIVTEKAPAFHCHEECETMSLVIEKAPGWSSSTLSLHELWNHMNAGIEDGTEEKRRMIHTVPEMFRQKESSKGCFDPIVVSIGPYHHGKKELREVERLKYSMALQFIEGCGMQFSDIYSEVKQISSAAREYYPQESVSKFDEKGFTTLMLVDGCFVLQFIDSMHNPQVEHVIGSNVAAFVKRDLMLLENQLPYIVLKKLMSLRFEGNEEDELIGKFISSIRGVSQPLSKSWIRATAEFYDKCRSKLKDIFKKGTANKTDQEKPAEEPNIKVRPLPKKKPLHLLDIFLSKYINKKDLPRRSSKSRDWYSYPAAKELRTLGIHFRPRKGKQFTDIKFIPTLTAGLLLLPQIMIDDTTKSMLLNLVAYETSPDAPDDLCGLTSYICFMDSLIDQAEDMKVLRSKDIVFNLLGSDQQAAELFNEIARDLVPNPYAFDVTRRGIEAQSKSRIRTWMAQCYNTHFSSPWTVIAFLAVAATIVMTVLQTYVSVKDYCSGEGRQDHASLCAFF